MFFEDQFQFFNHKWFFKVLSVLRVYYKYIVIFEYKY